LVHRDFERALVEYEIAREGLPSSGEVRFEMGHVLRRQGRWQESVAMYEEAIALDPRNLEFWSQLQNSLFLLRRYREAIDVGQRMLAMDPGRGPAVAEAWRFVDVAKSRKMWRNVTDSYPERAAFLSELDYLERKYEDALERLAAYEGEQLFYRFNFRAPKELRIGAVRAAMGDEAGALRAYERAREILEPQVRERPEDPRNHSALGLAYAGLGRTEVAIRHGRRATELKPVSEDALEGQSYLQNLARIYARVGEVEAALDTLEELFSIPADLSIYLLELDPLFDPLRDHPRYRELVERHRTAPGAQPSAEQ
jgi:serine/threonine-protein kinase